MTTKVPETNQAGGPVYTTIALDQPIVRGDQTFDTLRLRKPQSGELRGLSLVRLGQMDVEEIRKLLPRITEPTLTAQECDGLDLGDLMEIASGIGDFLLSRQRKAELPTT